MGCTAGGSTFDVCCPTCATGTYLPGQSCQVILPDPAACGIILSKDNNETDVTDVDVGADTDADADADPVIVISTDVPTVAPVEVPTDEGTLSPTFKEGDAPSVSEPSEVVQPIFEAPVAQAPISAAPVHGRRVVVATTTLAIVVAAAVVAAL